MMKMMTRMKIRKALTVSNKSQMIVSLKASLLIEKKLKENSKKYKASRLI